MMDNARDIGRHDEAIETLKKDMLVVRASLARIESTLAEHKGGMKMLVTVGALGGAIGAGAVKFLMFLKGGQ